LQKAFSRKRSVAGSEAIHVVEKVDETGLRPPRFARGRLTLFLAKTPIIVEVLI